MCEAAEINLNNSGFCRAWKFSDFFKKSLHLTQQDGRIFFRAMFDNYTR